MQRCYQLQLSGRMLQPVLLGGAWTGSTLQGYRIHRFYQYQDTGNTGSFSTRIQDTQVLLFLGYRTHRFYQYQDTRYTGSISSRIQDTQVVLVLGYSMHRFHQEKYGRVLLVLGVGEVWTGSIKTRGRRSMDGFNQYQDQEKYGRVPLVLGAGEVWTGSRLYKVSNC